MLARADVRNYLRQAARNQAVAQSCFAQAADWHWRQWAATAAFYAAVHLAKAIAVKKGETKSRAERYHDFYSRMIRTYTPAASVSYERLRTTATTVRYQLDMPRTATVRRLVMRDLARIDTRARAVCRRP